MIFPLTSLLVVILDQVTKMVAINHFKVHPESVSVVPNIFHLTFVQNTGVAFGMFREHSEILLVLISVSLALLAWYLYKQKESRVFLKLAYGFIVGGAIGNLIDRFRFGWVVDFFDFHIWPVFNVADSFITVGVALILIDLLFFEKRKV